MKKKVPEMTTDEEAEAFLDQDLSQLDFAAFKLVRFEFEKKAVTVNMRMPAALLDSTKARAQGARDSLSAAYPRDAGNRPSET